MIRVVYGEEWSEVASQRYLQLVELVKWEQAPRRSRTGRNKSRNHHITWLVTAADGPNTSIGSQSTRHSQIDQICDIHASKASIIGGSCGDNEANIYGNVSLVSLESTRYSRANQHHSARSHDALYSIVGHPET